MNVQRLIERIKRLDEPYLKAEFVLELVKQLDEPKPVKVPQCVADYIEESRLKGWDLLASMRFVVSAKNKKTTKWFYLGENKNIFARAWLDGYEVEEEKRYLVSLKNGQPLVRAPLGKNFYFNQNITAGNYKATRKQLKEAGFGWVFDCPGIEIEEVE